MTDWKILNYLSRSYLELQRTRVSMDLRIFKLKESALVDAGLYERIEEKKESKGKKSTSRTVRPIDKPQNEEQQKIFDEKVKAVIEKLKETSLYQILRKHRLQLYKQEKQIPLDAMPFFEGSGLWDWCHRTKGLAEVAVLTFGGYMDPSRFDGVYKVWAYAGLEPRGRRKKGEQASFTPLIKSRFWILMQNVIMARDPYYYPLYQIKKDYFQSRPDIAEQKEIQKGWKAATDRRAKFVLTKILTSHAFSLMNGEGDAAFNHTNPVPIRPVDAAEFDAIHKSYRDHHAKILEKLNWLWAHDKERYYHVMKHSKELDNFKPN